MIRLKIKKESKEKLVKKLKERRKHVRARRVLSVQHRLYKRKAKIIKGTWHSSLTENMSVSGLLFISPMPYLEGDILQMRVVMSGVLDIFGGLGKVIRVSATRNRKNFYVAVRYLSAEKSRRPIKSYS